MSCLAFPPLFCSLLGLEGAGICSSSMLGERVGCLRFLFLCVKGWFASTGSVAQPLVSDGQVLCG